MFCLSVFLFADSPEFYDRRQLNRKRNHGNNLDRMTNVSVALRKMDSYLIQKMNERSQMENKAICSRYYSEANTVKKIIPLWTNPNTPFDDVTLVTIMSVGKFHVLDMLLRQWAGPLSLVIYVDAKTRTTLLQLIERKVYLLKKMHVELSIIPGAFVSTSVKLVDVDCISLIKKDTLMGGL